MKLVAIAIAIALVILTILAITLLGFISFGFIALVLPGASLFVKVIGALLCTIIALFAGIRV